MSDQMNAQDGVTAGIARTVLASDQLQAVGVYTAKCLRPEPAYLERVIELRRKLASFSGLSFKLANARVQQIEDELAGIPHFLAWDDTYKNLVTTVGKNDMLDKYLAGSAFTAANYMGLISSVSYTAVAAADTMSSHTGWTEAGIANAPTYSNGARPTAAWAAASGGSKSLSSSLSFAITGPGTVKGSFLTTSSTKDGTTGILFSAGLFSGGDRVVSNGDSLSVAYSLSL